MTTRHAIVWIDHASATVIDIDHDAVHHLAARGHQRRTLHKASPAAVHQFHDDVARWLTDAREIVVVGPGTAKQEFVHDLDKRHVAIAKRVVGVETLDHPTDNQLAAFARKHFARVDALLGDEG